MNTSWLQSDIPANIAEVYSINVISAFNEWSVTTAHLNEQEIIVQPLNGTSLIIEYH